MNRAHTASAKPAADAGPRPPGQTRQRVAPSGHPFEQAARAGAAPQGPAPRGGLIDGPLGLTDGQTLPPAERMHFERLYGQDFSTVRIHADRRAQALARDLRARAFTSGTHVAFAAGRWQPGMPASRALLAHELVHVAQVQAAGDGSSAAATVWRAPEDEAMAEQPPTPQLSVEVTTSTDETPISMHMLNSTDEPVDETGSAVFEGDIVALRLADAQGREVGIEVDSLPPGLERSDASTPGRLLLRVRAAAESVSLRVRDAAGGGASALVTLRLQPRPAPRGTIDPVWAAHEAERSALAAERRTSREERRAERKAPRGASGKERRAARRERRDERARARAQRRERGAYLDQASCSPETQKAVDAAQQRGVQVCDVAIAALGRAPKPSAPVLAAVSVYLKFDAADPADATRLRSVIDVLSTARNSLAAADHASFVCADCDEDTGAFVMQNVRGGRVTLCPLWRTGSGLKFDFARGVDEARAAALVHEFVHLSGPSIDDEWYVSDTAAWAAVSPAQALRMADAYAALAFTAASGSGP